jgi:hypothetical protein
MSSGSERRADSGGRPSRRTQIAMSPEEVLAFLQEQRTVTCATAGPRAWPHLMPLWYVVRDGEIWAWTYGTSQKVRNLERDARATLQVEAGDSYDQLRGVMIEADAVIHRELDVVIPLGLELMARYAPPETDPEMLRGGVTAQAPKRVGLQFAPSRTASWDHRKLAGLY